MGSGAASPERERRAQQSRWVRAARQDRDEAILAADAAGDTAEAIGRSFGLSRMTVTRILRIGNQGARVEPVRFPRADAALAQGRTMTRPPAEPGVEALGESLSALAVQIADLRGQVAQVNQRLDRAGLHGDLDLVARFEELARTVADALDAVAPHGPAAPSWIGLDR